MSYIKQKDETVPADNIEGTISPNQVAFGDPVNSGKIKGSDNFTFVDETGGSGPTTAIKGDKPVFVLIDDTDVIDYQTELQQSGSSLYFLSKDTVGTNNQVLRVAPGSLIVNEGGVDIDFRVEGTTDANLLRTDAANDNVGIGTAPDSGVERLHIKGTGDTQPMVRLEATGDPGGATDRPVLDLYTPNANAAGENLGKVSFTGKDTTGNDEEFAAIEADIQDATAGSENGRMKFLGKRNAAEFEYMRYEAGNVTINELGADINFRIEGDNDDSLFRTDAGNDNVGIGTVPDSNVEKLHVKGTGLTDMVVFEGTSEGGGATDGPDLILYNSATPTGANKFIGRLEWRGKNDAAAAKGYGTIQTFIQDETAGTEDSLMLFKTFTAGSSLEKLRFNLGGTELNSTGSASLNFDVKTSSSSTQQSFFRTYNSATVANRYTEVLRGTDTISTTPRTITEDYCYGSNVYMTGSASVITLPEGLPGMHLQVVNGGLTGLTMNPAAGEEINGSSSAYSLADGYKITKVICVAAGEWVASD